MSDRVLEIRSGAATDVGRVRQVNEDSVLAAGRLAAVADGMGGHAAGDVASRLAIQSLEQLLFAPGQLTTDEVLRAIDRANQEILDAAVSHPRASGMGTTLAGVAVVGLGGTDHFLIFNIGDSRVYRYADGALVQVTVDHSEVQELVSVGLLTAAEAQSDQRRNIVTRSLGSDPAPQPDTWFLPPNPGDRFLVCSDGLTTELSDDDIERRMASHAPPQVVADDLVAAALEAGARDNVTAIVIDLLDQDASSVVDGDTAPRPVLGDG